jgi:hypothetical protein
MNSVIARIDASPLAEWVRVSVWAYPILEIVHIAAFAALFGSLLLFELRVFGAATDIALRPLTRLAVRTALAAFVLAALSGGAMWASNAVQLSEHPAFLAKLGMIGIAGLNAAVFHWRDGVGRHDAAARGQALLSLLLWLGIIGAGRLIAYL